MRRRTISEAGLERAVDLAVVRRLSTDSAYRNAEDAEAQAVREAAIEREELARLLDHYELEVGL